MNPLWLSREDCTALDKLLLKLKDPKPPVLITVQRGQVLTEWHRSSLAHRTVPRLTQTPRAADEQGAKQNGRFPSPCWWIRLRTAVQMLSRL